MKRLLSAMGITVSVARWVLVSSVVTLAVIANFCLIFLGTDTQLPSGTLVATIVLAAIALIILLLSAWLGYFKSGQALILSNQIAPKRHQHTPTMVGRVLKTLFASFALAVGIFIIVDIITLFTFGPDVVQSTFDTFMTPIVGLLTLLCFPLLYKWLK